MKETNKLRFIKASKWKEMSFEEIMMSLATLKNALRFRELSEKQALCLFDEALSLIEVAREKLGK